jgi:hypothetical protein
VIKNGLSSGFYGKVNRFIGKINNPQGESRTARMIPKKARWKSYIYHLVFARDIK